MPIETELKLHVASHEPVRKRLSTLGATFIERVLERNLIFDRPDGSLRKRGCGLRVRSTVDKESGERRATMTFKGPRAPGPLKRRQELEVEVSDGDMAAAMLDRLGFAEILDYQKSRESWQLGPCRIELDEPPHLGLFLEIEGPDEAAIREAQRQLELTAAREEPNSYVALLIAYCNEHGIADRTLCLPDETPAT